MLFVGETWRGSSARSLREALAQLSAVEIDDIGEDHYFPKGRSLLVRGTNRLLSRVHRAELASEISTKLSALRPDVLLVYKGSGINANVVRQAKQAGVFTVNVFPDPSPHAFGKTLHEAMGEYDLVVSTKPFHPPGWTSIYGYRNRCVCVQHGYDPAVHYWRDPPEHQDRHLRGLPSFLHRRTEVHRHRRSRREIHPPLRHGQIHPRPKSLVGLLLIR